jgi:hypothetical protein
MVGPKFIPVAGPADTLKVFAAVWIPCPQSPDESSRQNVIDMATHSWLLEIDSTRLNLAVPFERRGSMVLPALAIGGCSKPFPVHALPTHSLLLGAEPGFAEVATPVAVGFATAIDCFENFGLRISTIGAQHSQEPPFP